MLQIDEFESVFRSAIKEAYSHQAVTIRKALLITDLGTEKTQQLLSAVKVFCQHLAGPDGVDWQVMDCNTSTGCGALLERIDESTVDLVITYRNLYSDAWRHPYSLGEHLDILLQKTSVPILVIPHPLDESSQLPEQCRSALVVTDHMIDDQALIQQACSIVGQDGDLHLSHIEDSAYFARILAAISKIPTINTDEASDKLAKQLLKEPTEYIESVKEAISSLGLGLTIHSTVEFGHQLKDHIRYIEDHKVDVLVINTKDGDQMAMHGLAYPLAVEVRHIPLLML